MGRVRRGPVTLLALVLVIAGCGRERLGAPDPGAPFTAGVKTAVAYPKAGLRFDAPADWPFGAGPAPLVAQTSSGSATIAIWRYPRTEPLPRDRAALATARTNLVNAAKGRDGSFKTIATHLTKIDGKPAVQVVGDETVAGRPRRVRSTHVYAHGAEVVIDAFSDPGVFLPVDRVVFRPLLRSIELDRPRA